MTSALFMGQEPMNSWCESVLALCLSGLGLGSILPGGHGLCEKQYASCRAYSPAHPVSQMKFSSTFPRTTSSSSSTENLSLLDRKSVV